MHFSTLSSENISIYPLRIFRKKLANRRHTPVPICGTHNEAPGSVSADLSRRTSTNAYRGDASRGCDARVSARARSLSPWLESRWQALLSCRRDEIRYFVKVISPRKVSFRRVIASAPLLPAAAALHATRAREERRKGESKGPISKAGRLILPEETPGTAAGESRAEVKDRSVTLIEGKLHSLFYR